MLTLGTNLSTTLKSKATEACWLLDIYYNDDTSASNVIHLSDRERTVDSVDYKGLVRSWGSFNQKCDLVEFTSNIGNMTIILFNDENVTSAGRFTDWLATHNIHNRKWEIYLSDGINKSTEPIASGLISDDFESTEKDITIQLLSYEGKFDIEIPGTVVDSSHYPNAPKKNINKPFPMSFGDFSSYGTSGSWLEFTLTRGKFPAIITDAKDIDAYPDKAGEAMNELNDRNLFIKTGDYFCVCDPDGVSVGAGTPIIIFGGNHWILEIPILSDNSKAGMTGTESASQAYDKDENTVEALYSYASGNERKFQFYLPVVPEIVTWAPELGPDNFGVNLKITGIDSDEGTDPGVRVRFKQGTDYDVGAWTEYTWAVGGESRSIDSGLPEMGAYIEIGIRDINTTGLVGLSVSEISVYYAASPLETYAKEVVTRRPSKLIRRFFTPWGRKVLGLSKRTRTDTYYKDFTGEYVYFAGRGREYDDEIDTVAGNARAAYTDETDPGYNAGTVIRNPIYIVEYAHRKESDSDDRDGPWEETDIDLASFDIAGNTPDGLIGDVFNDAVTDIKFAFSQYQFVSLKDFREQVGRQCGTLFFVSGSGKLKAKTRRRPGDYSAGDENMEIDYNDMKNIKFCKTPLEDVRNDITVKYNFDYTLQETVSSIDNIADATSIGTTVDGYNQVLYLEEIMDCCLDATTADNWADYLLAILKDRHICFDFEINRAYYQALEIGDTIEFINWDSNFEIYGTVPATTDLYAVLDITKSGPNKTKIKVMEIT